MYLSQAGLREQVFGTLQDKRVLEIPFSSSRKMMMTVCQAAAKSLGPGGIQLPEDTQSPRAARSGKRLF